MLSFNGLRHFKIRTADNRLAAIRDVCFDAHFTVRQLVIQSGSWLLGNLYSLNPLHITEVNLAEKQIRTSLSFRQLEKERVNELEPGWMIPARDTVIFGGVAANFEAALAQGRYSTEVTTVKNPLISSRHFLLYEVLGVDGFTGSMRELIFDIQSWKLSYLVIESGARVFGKKIMCPVENIGDMAPGRETVFLSMSRDQFAEAPGYLKHNPVNKTLEERFYDFEGDFQSFEVRQVSSEHSGVLKSLENRASLKEKVS